MTMEVQNQTYHPAYVIMKSWWLLSSLHLLLLLSLFPEGALSSSSSSSLLLHPNGCFVSQYKCNQLLSRKSRTVHIFAKKRGVTPSNNNNQGENNNNNSNKSDYNISHTTPNYKRQLIPTLMYTIVPFLPSITIQTLNDQYQQFKQQFNMAAASLPPNASPDSIEYITASNMYNTSMQSLLLLLLSKRVALYFLATMATLYAGWRASVTIGRIEGGYLGGPGMALDYLNREVLKGEKTIAIVGSIHDYDDENVNYFASDKEKKEGGIDDEKLFATLVDDSAQSTNVGSAIALILPLLLGASLALSYSLISFFGSGSSSGPSISSSIIGDKYWSVIQGMLPYLTSIPSMALCILFVATEFRSRALSNKTLWPLLCAENISALLYVAGAYIAKFYPTITFGECNLDLAPLQNGVNIAFAATVVRALSPFLISYTTTTTSDSSSKASSPTVSSISIRTMALALIGVTMFDGISVFGTVANAVTIDTVAPTSVMETVATYKVDAQLWNPGLLSVVVGHSQKARITEALGLGDVVFPACLVAWSFFVDSVSNKTTADDTNLGEMPRKQISYTTAAIAGYVSGSAATEIVGSFSLLGGGRGLPALIFLIPSMLLAVTTVAWSRGGLNEVWGSSSVVENTTNISD